MAIDKIEQRPPSGAVYGIPRALLRLEGLAVLGLSLFAYAHFGLSWGWFAALFLIPDLSMLGYLVGRRIGAASYNAGHSYLGPTMIGLAGLATADPFAQGVALIWVAHIGFDRAVGYGLKYGTAFKDTHLGEPFKRRVRA